ncbi:helix-turn-helix transcriptional regulator [Streptomyces sp. NBC_00272]|uniref:helix-turn-helix transcriptional regulator n=1 Tax=Streptomyces sp. NBC_00272 TaxID=2975698 RepID=UPI002E2D6960|nr:LuxR C-terminal-related transcriptional regulator [Streptomyces sp. NBC_00272]
MGADSGTGVPRLDEPATLLYRWTLVHGRLTPTTLPRAAAETGLSEQACTGAIAQLAEVYLFQPLPGGNGGGEDADAGWRAVSPQSAGAQVLAEKETELRAHEADLREQREQLQRQRDGFSALVPVYLQARRDTFPEGTIDHLPDQFAVRALLTEVVDTCRSEVLVSKHGGSFPPAALREALPRDLALLARGVRMRSLYQHATRFDQATRVHAEQLIGAGAEIRTLPEVLPQMILVDGQLALLPARSGGALVIREPDLIGYLLDVFQRDWANATPFATGPQAAHGVSEAMKRSILVLLAKGLKDESIARRLGVSLRTCRRHVSEILDGLGAHSRFQAGVIAERKGLTGHPVAAPAVPAREAPVGEAPTAAAPEPVPDLQKTAAKSGTGTDAGAGTGAEAAARAGVGTGVGTRAEAGVGTRAEAGVEAGVGARAEAGAGAGTGAEAAARAGVEAGAGTRAEAGVGTRAGAGARPGVGSPPRCPGCDRPLPVAATAQRQGRPPRYCSAPCRSRAYRARLKSRQAPDAP